MEITLNNNLILNIFVFLVIPYFTFKDIKIFRGDHNEEVLSKNNTDVLKGISVIVVILSHLALFSTKKGLITIIFFNAGFLAVSVFLFISGYGLMMQNIKKDNYIRKNMPRKIFKLYLQFIMANVLTTIIDDIFLGTNYGVIEILKTSLLMRFVDGRELWFVAAILYFYLVLYISFKFLREKQAIIMVCIAPIIYIMICVFFKRGTWWENTAFCFSMGVLFALYKEKILINSQKMYKTRVITVLLAFISMMYLYTKGITVLQFIIPIVFVTLIVLILMKINLKSKIMQYINKISFEMYLMHLVVLKVAFSYNTARDSSYVVLLFPLMILVSIVLKKISSAMFSIKIKNRNHVECTH